MEVSVKFVFVAALVCARILQPAHGYRILGVFPHLAKSHFIMSRVIMRELAMRGHDITVISPFPEENPPKNYKDIALLKPDETIVNAFEVENFDGKGIVNICRLIYQIGINMCEVTYSSPEVQKLLHSNEKFDLVIVEIFNTDCFLAFAHRFNTTAIGISSSAMLPWANERFGNPDNPSYIPVIFTGYSDKMSFTERLANAFILWACNLAYKYIYNAKANQIIGQHFGESFPTVEEMSSKMSMFLINTQPALHQARPFVPAIVEVGGIHVNEPKGIPQEFDKFLNESKHGVIYFSLGSTVRSNSFPEGMRRGLLEAFSELPQRVLWKWESDSMPDQPSNVKISKWMPQLEILSHPNVRVFITHGGLMGTLEAAYFGVPMVAIPLFGDQFYNVKSYVQKGIAVQMDYNTISKKTALAALKTVLENPSYAENARRVRDALRDRPMSPLDTAVYWIQYVVRHGGAPHLRSAAADLRWYQYSLLDVAAALLLAAVTLALLARAVARRLFCTAARQHGPPVKDGKTKRS